MHLLRPFLYLTFQERKKIWKPINLSPKKDFLFPKPYQPVLLYFIIIFPVFLLWKLRMNHEKFMPL